MEISTLTQALTQSRFNVGQTSTRLRAGEDVTNVLVDFADNRNAFNVQATALARAAETRGTLVNILA